jgi:hypothetical protein
MCPQKVCARNLSPDAKVLGSELGLESSDYEWINTDYEMV